ncbi:MAG: PilN domain-containing protein [Deltaproteobacteria bacterium]
MKDINLVPQYVISEKRSMELKQRIIIWGSVFLLLIVVYIGWLFILKASIKSDISRIEKSIAELKPLKDENDLVTVLKTDREAKKVISQATENENTVMMRFLEKLESQLPQAVGASSITFNSADNRVTITANAANAYAITDFINNYGEDKSFEGDYFIPSVPIKGNGMFTVSFKYIDRK